MLRCRSATVKAGITERRRRVSGVLRARRSGIAALRVARVGGPAGVRGGFRAGFRERRRDAAAAVALAWDARGERRRGLFRVAMERPPGRYPTTKGRFPASLQARSAGS